MDVCLAIQQMNEEASQKDFNAIEWNRQSPSYAGENRVSCDEEDIIKKPSYSVKPKFIEFIGFDAFFTSKTEPIVMNIVGIKYRIAENWV